MFIQLRQLLRRGRSQKGSAAVEFAIVLPVLLLLLLGAMDMGHMYYIDQLITKDASREGARYAAKFAVTGTAPTSGQISGYVTLPSGLNYNTFNLDALTVTASYAGMVPNKIATVTVTAQKHWWVLGTLAGFSHQNTHSQYGHERRGIGCLIRGGGKKS